MIIYRKFYVKNRSEDYSIWEYDTETKMERCIYIGRSGNRYRKEWTPYSPINKYEEREERISKKDAFLEML